MNVQLMTLTPRGKGKQPTRHGMTMAPEQGKSAGNLIHQVIGSGIHIRHQTIPATWL